MAQASPAALPLDASALSAWIGRAEHRSDVVSSAPLVALEATLDRSGIDWRAGAAIPPLRHWLYFLPTHRASDLGPDGHARRGEFLPPVPLPRRMWAGSRLQFSAPVRVGDAIARDSRIDNVEVKQGRTGPLVFVRVRHEIRVSSEVAIIEEHDIVYRGHPGAQELAPAPEAAPVNAAWRQNITPDPVLLFRYSALTFNGHRIHYDWRYVTEFEGYPDLIVHGPLIATLLVDLARDHAAGREIASFSFRAIKPLFCNERFAVCGRAEGESAVSLWAQDAHGQLAMRASATLR
ncbi:MAG: MaoC family dehydratase N-terminal domain-containing protein [Pseudomonadota bacterium]|nr:MaoC family dehydratase N-terminal domain-containing protein [Pseudomonadota bacterium]